MKNVKILRLRRAKVISLSQSRLYHTVQNVMAIVQYMCTASVSCEKYMHVYSVINYDCYTTLGCTAATTGWVYDIVTKCRYKPFYTIPFGFAKKNYTRPFRILKIFPSVFFCFS